MSANILSYRLVWLAIGGLSATALYSLWVYWCSASLAFSVLASSIFSLVLAAYFVPSASGPSLRGSVIAAVFVFILLIPPLELLNGLTYWGRSSSVFQFYTLAMLACLVWFCSFIMGWFFGSRFTNPRRINFHSLTRPAQRFLPKIILASCAFLSAYIIFESFEGNLLNIIYREKSLEGTSSSSWWLIRNFFILPIAPVCLLIAVVERWGIFFIFYFMGLTALVAFPTALPRFQAAQLYFPLLFAFFPFLAKSRYGFDVLLVIGLLTLFPLMDIFRYRTLDGAISVRGVFDFSWVSQGHFDNFQNLAALIASKLGPVPEQAVGSLFFFLPRAIWPGKPVHSGELLGDIEGLSLTNISMNLVGESLLIGGGAGIFFFGFIFGALCGLFDSRSMSRGSLAGTMTILYWLLLASAFFFFRGSLMNGMAYTTGVVLVVLLLSQVKNFFTRVRWSIPAKENIK